MLLQVCVGGHLAVAGGAGRDSAGSHGQPCPRAGGWQQPAQDAEHALHDPAAGQAGPQPLCLAACALLHSLPTVSCHRLVANSYLDLKVTKA